MLIREKLHDVYKKGFFIVRTQRFSGHKQKRRAVFERRHENHSEKLTREYKAQLFLQKDQMNNTEALLESSMPDMTTSKIAEALQSSNPLAVKGFSELFLQQYKKEDDIEMVIPKLVEKIGGVAFLDLNNAEFIIFNAVLRIFPDFLQLFTASAILSRLNEYYNFVDLLEICMDFFKSDAELEEGGINSFWENQRDFFGKGTRFLEIEHNKTFVQKTVEKSKKEQSISLEREVANRKVANALVNVVTEMKHRFEAAVSFDEEQKRKEPLVLALKNIWTPTARQEKIRAISPKAAQILEEMAR